ncbi:MAG: hypothetical protein HQ537_01605 [Parcubacteria group bacterium]|nr:hypothetical protein [Parcubacteria group bacterium]
MNIKNRFIAISLIICLGAVFGFSVKAFQGKDTYPKIANYYLQPLVPKNHYSGLAEYDLLILDVDVQTIDPNIFSYIKEKNPEVKFFAYIPSQSVNTQDLSSWARFRNMVFKKVNSNDWWLKDSQGNSVSFSNTWPIIKFVDPGQGWNDYLSDLASEDVMSRNVWDGIFYDMVFANLSWLNNGDIDINQDGQKDDIDEINNYWQLYMTDLMNQTKAKIGSSPLVANVDIVDKYQDELNGLMMENFPADWLGENGWSILINQYLNNLPLNNKLPQIYIINSNTDNAGKMESYRKMRFGLASTLLGDGYFSFDSGDQAHNQIWLYDEYEAYLGKAISSVSNLLDKPNQEIKPGLWRRDFENGLVLVNSTNQEQMYVFNQEEFSKINGEQDRRINNGIKVNWISLEPKDGIVLLKTIEQVENNAFLNGSFVRVFNKEGDKVKNGFFAFKNDFPGQSQLLITDIDEKGDSVVLVNKEGKIFIYQNGKEINNFTPYKTFKGEISLAVGNVNNDGQKEIITGAGPGGGPHVKVFSLEAQMLNEFMAYDENFRGGVMVMADDIDEDNKDEILTGVIDF